jgi:hypothetical protein
MTYGHSLEHSKSQWQLISPSLLSACLLLGGPFGGGRLKLDLLPTVAISYLICFPRLRGPRGFEPKVVRWFIHILAPRQICFQAPGFQTSCFCDSHLPLSVIRAGSGEITGLWLKRKHWESSNKQTQDDCSSDGLPSLLWDAIMEHAKPICL